MTEQQCPGACTIVLSVTCRARASAADCRSVVAATVSARRRPRIRGFVLGAPPARRAEVQSASGRNPGQLVLPEAPSSGALRA